MQQGQGAPTCQTGTPKRRRHATRNATGRMMASGPSREEGTAVTHDPACGWLTRFRRCRSRGEEKEATRPERMDESRVKEASCWEGQGEGEEDQPRREPQAENTSKQLALKAPSAWATTWRRPKPPSLGIERSSRGVTGIAEGEGPE